MVVGIVTPLPNSNKAGRARGGIPTPRIAVECGISGIKGIRIAGSRNEAAPPRRRPASLSAVAADREPIQGHGVEDPRLWAFVAGRMCLMVLVSPELVVYCLCARISHSPGSRTNRLPARPANRPSSHPEAGG